MGPISMNPQEGITVRIGDSASTNGPPTDYFVTVFKALKSGALYALVLRVTVAQPIQWVRAHADEIAAIGVQQDTVARNPNLPIVALNAALASEAS